MTPSIRQYAGNVVADGAAPRPAGGFVPAAIHSVFVTVNSTPGTCSCVSAAHAAGVVGLADCAMAPDGSASRNTAVIVGIFTSLPLSDGRIARQKQAAAGHSNQTVEPGEKPVA